MNSYESSSFSPRKRPRLSPQTSLSYFNSSSTHPSSTSKDDPKGNTEATSPPQADEQTSGFYLFKSLSLSGMNFDSTSINSQHRRLIIGLDIDNFYVAAARKLDPSLIGKPVGIKQKNILATISYEARALGIPKLSTVSGALKLCPSLILVNGEDLSFFRKLSREVFMIVRRILWNFGEKMNMEQRHRLEEFTLGEKRVEKLGMDELWIDVTDMIDYHLSKLSKRLQDQDQIESHFLDSSLQPATSSPSPKHVWFSFSLPPNSTKDQKPNIKGKGKEALRHLEEDQNEDLGTSNEIKAMKQGFWYLPFKIAGNLVPSLESEDQMSSGATSSQSLYLLRLSLASQFAQHLRTLIYKQTKLTLSAGISHNKLISKIIGGFKKPDGQSCFAPFKNEEKKLSWGEDEDKSQELMEGDEAEDRDGIGEGKDGDEVGDEETNFRNLKAREMLQELNARKLNGFGSGNVEKIRNAIQALDLGKEKKASNGEGYEDEGSHSYLHASKTLPSHEKGNSSSSLQVFGNTTNVKDKMEKDGLSTSPNWDPNASSPLSVKAVLSNLSDQDFINLFGEKLGLKLYDLLMGIDLEEVKSSPLFPLQIGIEDTFPGSGLRTRIEVERERKKLCESLGRRLEDELLETEEHDSTVNEGEQVRKKWLRYPKSIRISIRKAWKSRISRSSKISVQFFEVEDLSFEKRVEVLSRNVGVMLDGLLGKGWGQKADDDSVNMVNITVYDLSKERPEKGIGSFFKAQDSLVRDFTKEGGSNERLNSEPVKSERHQKQQNKEQDRRSSSKSVLDLNQQIDLETLLELPEEMRREILKTYGIEECWVEEESRRSFERGYISDLGSREKEHGQDELQHRSPDSRLRCRDCGEMMDVWLQHDHQLFPMKGIPNDLADD